MKRIRIKILVCLLLIFLGAVSFSFCGCSDSSVSGPSGYSAGTGSLEGTFIAPNGKFPAQLSEGISKELPLGYHPVQGAVVSLSSGAFTNTDENGRFYFSNVNAGSCSVTITATGYKKLVFDSVTIQPQTTNYVVANSAYVTAIPQEAQGLSMTLDQVDLSAWPQVAVVASVMDISPPVPVAIAGLSSQNFQILLNGVTALNTSKYSVVARSDGRYNINIPDCPTTPKLVITLNYGGMTSSALIEVPGGRMIAVLVGVNLYRDIGPDLPECRADAYGTQASLVGSTAWEDSEITVLTDTQPTKEAVRTAILAHAGTLGPEDLFFLVFSSHGTNDGETGYVIPYDGGLTASSMISGEELKGWLEQLRKPGQLTNFCIILDSCYSGLFIGKAPPGVVSKFVPFRGSVRDFKGDTPVKQLQLMPDSVVITASAGSETSLAVPSFGQSLGMHYIIEGLGPGGTIGPADKNRNGQITMAELHEYMDPLVIAYANSVFHDQHPQFYNAFQSDVTVLKY